MGLWYDILESWEVEENDNNDLIKVHFHLHSWNVNEMEKNLDSFYCTVVNHHEQKNDMNTQSDTLDREIYNCNDRYELVDIERTHFLEACTIELFFLHL